MTDDEAKAIPIAILMSTILGFLFGLWWAGSSWEGACVKQGVAEYNHTTGDWQWKGPPPVEVLPGEDPQKREGVFPK
jgi:hypothetical protein